MSGGGAGGVGLVAGNGVENVNDDDDDSVGPTERCASNLFDRFAARPQALPLPARAHGKKALSCGAGPTEAAAAAEISERGVTAAAAAAERDERDTKCRDERSEDRDERGKDRDERGQDRDERGKDRDERAKDRDEQDEDRGERGKGRECLTRSEFGDGAKVGVGAGGGGVGGGRGGGPLSELSVNSVAARSVVACRASLRESQLAVAKGGGSCGPGQACAVGGSGESAPLVTFGGRRRRGEEQAGSGGARPVCGGVGGCECGDSCGRSSSGSKRGSNGDSSGKKPCSGRRMSGGVEGVRDSLGGGGDRERSSEKAGSRNNKAAGGGGGDGSGGVDGSGDLFMRFMYNA